MQLVRDCQVAQVAPRKLGASQLLIEPICAASLPHSSAAPCCSAATPRQSCCRRLRARQSTSPAARLTHKGGGHPCRCTRAAFHDGGANALDEVGATVGTKKGQVVTAPKGGGGLDASLLLTDEQLRAENAYDRCSPRRSGLQRPAAAEQAWRQRRRHTAASCPQLPTPAFAGCASRAACRHRPRHTGVLPLSCCLTRCSLVFGAASPPSRRR
jgi:hypothetical protein